MRERLRPDGRLADKRMTAVETGGVERLGWHGDSEIGVPPERPAVQTCGAERMPRPDRPPAFLVYPADFVSDGKVEAMTTEEVGAYWLLMCKAWFETPVGSIPSDDAVLARWARVTPRRWIKIKAGALSGFRLESDGRLHQPRMKIEHEKILARSESARGSAEKRWKNLPTQDAIALRSQCEGNARAIGLDIGIDFASGIKGGVGGNQPTGPPAVAAWPDRCSDSVRLAVEAYYGGGPAVVSGARYAQAADAAEATSDEAVIAALAWAREQTPKASFTRALSRAKSAEVVAGWVPPPAKVQPVAEVKDVLADVFREVDRVIDDRNRSQNVGR